MFINDINKGVEDLEGFLSKFADDSKWARKVMGEEDREAFQLGIDHLQEWAETWQMEFNQGKCHVLHLGRNNRRYEYTMGGKKLEETEFEKDLGVMIHQTLKPSMQCARAAKKGNSVLGQMLRGVGYRDKKVFIDLYKTYVRPHLEYCSAAWSPWQVGDTELLEAVQRRAVKAVSNLKSRTYEDRLKELGLDSLAERRKRGDLIQAYRVFSGHDRVDPATWFKRSIPADRNVQLVLDRPTEGRPTVEGAVTTRRQGGFWNVDTPEWNGEIRRNFWSVRVCDPWNDLPDSLKMTESVNGFKNALDEHRGWGRQQQRN